MAAYILDDVSASSPISLPGSAESVSSSSPSSCFSDREIPSEMPSPPHSHADKDSAPRNTDPYPETCQPQVPGKSTDTRQLQVPDNLTIDACKPSVPGKPNDPLKPPVSGKPRDRRKPSVIRKPPDSGTPSVPCKRPDSSAPSVSYKPSDSGAPSVSHKPSDSGAPSVSYQPPEPCYPPPNAYPPYFDPNFHYPYPPECYDPNFFRHPHHSAKRPRRSRIVEKHFPLPDERGRHRLHSVRKHCQVFHHQRCLGVLCLPDSGFTLTNGVTSYSVDRDRDYQRKLLEYMSLLHVEGLVATDERTKLHWKAIVEPMSSLNHFKDIKLSVVPHPKDVGRCIYCQSSKCHRWLAIQGGISQILNHPIEPIQH